jgi:hypothetical protein
MRITNRQQSAGHRRDEVKAPKDLSELLDSLCAGIAERNREASEMSLGDAFFDAVVRAYANNSLAASAKQTDPITMEIVAHVVEASCAPLAAIDTHPNQGERS